MLRVYLFIAVCCVSPGVNGKLRINEFNADCPPVGNPIAAESCEFIEFAETNCNLYPVWTRIPSTYFAIIETGTTPTVRLLLNLTDVSVVPGKQI